MIKEIAEEYNRNNRENVYNLLNKIKDLEYEVLALSLATIKHVDKKEQKSIEISFLPYYKNITEIVFYDLNNFNNRIIRIDKYLDTKGVADISEELYNKYFGGQNESN